MIYSAALISASETTTMVDITGHGVYVSDSDIYAEQMTRTRAALYADVREVTDGLGITGMSKLPKFALAGMVADWATGTRQGQRELDARRAATALATTLVDVTIALLEERGETDPLLIHSTVKRVVVAWYVGDMQKAAGTDEWDQLNLECQAVLDAARRLLVNGKGIVDAKHDSPQDVAQAAAQRVAVYGNPGASLPDFSCCVKGEYDEPSTPQFNVIAEGFVYADGTVVGTAADVQLHPSRHQGPFGEPTAADLRYEVRPYGRSDYGVYDNTRKADYQLVTGPWDRENADNLAAKYNAGEIERPYVISRHGH